MKYALLNRISEIYKSDGNIMEFLKRETGQQQNTTEDILISYDFQAGSYSEAYLNDPTLKDAATKELYTYLTSFSDIQSVLEIGVGEATTLVSLLNQFSKKDFSVKGVDLSWSRIKAAQKMLEINKLENIVELATSDLFNLPLPNNSVDLLYTFHSLEPNGGKEKEALEELYRVTSKYMVLVEPSYEFGSEQQKKRMKKNGYVIGLYDMCKELGYDVTVYEKFHTNANPLNVAEIIIVHKKEKKQNSFEWCCPITKTTLQNVEGGKFSEESLLVYPVIAGVPCLLEENAIVATKMKS